MSKIDLSAITHGIKGLRERANSIPYADESFRLMMDSVEWNWDNISSNYDSILELGNEVLDHYSPNQPNDRQINSISNVLKTSLVKEFGSKLDIMSRLKLKNELAKNQNYNYVVNANNKPIEGLSELTDVDEYVSLLKKNLHKSRFRGAYKNMDALPEENRGNLDTLIYMVLMTPEQAGEVHKKLFAKKPNNPVYQHYSDILNSLTPHERGEEKPKPVKKKEIKPTANRDDQKPKPVKKKEITPAKDLDDQKPKKKKTRSVKKIFNRTKKPKEIKLKTLEEIQNSWRERNGYFYPYFKMETPKKIFDYYKEGKLLADELPVAFNLADKSFFREYDYQHKDTTNTVVEIAKALIEREDENMQAKVLDAILAKLIGGYPSLHFEENIPLGIELFKLCKDKPYSDELQKHFFTSGFLLEPTNEPQIDVLAFSIELKIETATKCWEYDTPKSLKRSRDCEMAVRKSFWYIPMEMKTVDKIQESIVRMKEENKDNPEHLETLERIEKGMWKQYVSRKNGTNNSPLNKIAEGHIAAQQKEIDAAAAGKGSERMS